MFAKPYARYYDLFNSDKPYKKEIEFVYGWSGKPKSIFDIGCGTGNYWKFYPNKTRILGVDKSSSMVEMCRDHREILCADITTLKVESNFDCATALFDVINYIPRHDWWKNIPVKKGGNFVFDLLDKKKIDQDGFRETTKKVKGIFRRITPLSWNDSYVDLSLEVYEGKNLFEELHRMYLYSHEDIESFCGKEFELVEMRKTKRWQTWYKLIRK